jgi:hypothetical protein
MRLSRGMSEKQPRSPYDELDGLVYFPRLCDKIRLHHHGQLPADYHGNLGIGMDLWTCQFLGVKYEELAEQVRAGASDEMALAWAKRNGIKRPEEERVWWNAYMKTRGFRDDLAERLADRIKESGLEDRQDIVTFMDYIDADEGR